MKEIITDLIIAAGLAGIALGRIPRLKMNRATIALFFAIMLIAAGSISLDEAGSAIDLGAIALLFAMMIIIANLRLSGFFSAASARIVSLARSPRGLLALVVFVSGFFAAFFLNDTVCVMLTPLVIEMTLRAKRDPLPYLIGLATAANVGSCATIIGNPQNMLIGAASGIPFGEFMLKLAPPSIAGLFAVWLIILLVYPKEFAAGSTIEPAQMGLDAPAAPKAHINRPLLVWSLAATVLMLVLLFCGVKSSLAALIGAALLLPNCIVSADDVFAGVDFSVLVFFCGLFIITGTIEKTGAFGWCVQKATPYLGSGTGAGPLAFFSGLTLLFSNLISNVPTVMLFRPFVSLFRDAEKAWLVLALASTYAGNLTLLGSVANLIVAESARSRGIRLSFGAYLKAGLPITLITAVLGTVWLILI